MRSPLSKGNMKTIDLNSLIGTNGRSTQAALAKTMRLVCETDAPVAIDGAGKDQVVMVPLKTFKELDAQLDSLKTR